jgi:glycosyltransferase involved in cell wall biosynthesis
MAILTTQPGVPLPELVDGENILLVPPEDPQVLAQAINQLAADPDLRQRLGAGAEILSQRFHWDRIAAETLDLYRAIGADL